MNLGWSALLRPSRPGPEKLTAAQGRRGGCASCGVFLGFRVRWGGPSMRLPSLACLQAAHLVQGSSWKKGDVTSNRGRCGEQGLGAPKPEEARSWGGAGQVQDRDCGLVVACRGQGPGFGSSPVSVCASAISYRRPLSKSLNLPLLRVPICKMGTVIVYATK